MNDIYIFDDFYADPYSVREFALHCDYTLTAPTKWKHNTETVLWPGYATSSMYKEKAIDIRVSKLLGKPYRSSNTSGFFRISGENDHGGYYAHTDGLPVVGKTHYTGVVYLSLPEHCENRVGTIFFRHKKTGKIKLETAQDYNATLYDLKDSDAWEIDRTVEMKFNRLILLDQTLFHAIGEIFGDTKENGRLAQILNFSEV